MSAVVLAVVGVLAGYLLAYMRSSAPDRAFREVAAGTVGDSRGRLTSQRPPGPPRSSCRYTQNAFRSGVDPPDILFRSDVDLAGLAVPPGEHMVIVELRLNPDGRVTEACVLRGLAEDIDRRVLAAVRHWRFEPARLKNDAVIEGRRLARGSPVPIFLTVAVRVAPK